MVRVVDAPDRAVRRDGDAVRALAEQPIWPRTDEPAIALVREDRGIAAGEDVDPVARVDRDRGDILVPASGRKLLPPIDR
jgi:hypothetical protein